MQDGCTPLYIASQFGQLEVVKALIERRADVEAAKNVSSTSAPPPKDTHFLFLTHTSSTSGHRHALAHERARARMQREL